MSCGLYSGWKALSRLLQLKMLGALPNTANPDPRKVRKKTRRRPVPEPYLAVAPRPVTNVPMASTSALILPSTYVRSLHSTPSPNPRRRRPSNIQRPSSSSLGESTAPQARGYAAGLLAPPAVMPAAQGRTSASPTPQIRGGYAAHLLSPPTIMPGGRSALPLVPPVVPVGRTSPRPASSRRLPVPQNMNANSSETLLPQSDEPATFQLEPWQQPQQRRRRLVNRETSMRRRLTVSSAEEGRAMIARGASVRRTNVWDCELGWGGISDSSRTRDTGRGPAAIPVSNYVQLARSARVLADRQRLDRRGESSPAVRSCVGTSR